MTAGLEGSFPDNHHHQPLAWADIFDLMAELKGMARGLLSYEGKAGSVKTTALVLTALRRQRKKDQEWDEVTWANRRQFFGQVYKAMRRALIDYARKRSRERQHAAGNFDSESISTLVGSGVLQLDRLFDQAASRAQLAEAVDAALETLESRYPKQQYALIVEHYCFGTLNMSEIARIIGVSERTIRTRLGFAYAFLRQELQEFFVSAESTFDEPNIKPNRAV